MLSKTNKQNMVRILKAAKVKYPDAYITKRSTKRYSYQLVYTCPTHGKRTHVLGGVLPRLYKKLVSRDHFCTRCNLQHMYFKPASHHIECIKKLIAKRNAEGRGPLVEVLKYERPNVSLKCPTHGLITIPSRAFRDNWSWTCLQCSKELRGANYRRPELFESVVNASDYEFTSDYKYEGSYVKVKLICYTHKRIFKVIPNGVASSGIVKGCSLCREQKDTRKGVQVSLNEINAQVAEKNIKCLKFKDALKCSQVRYKWLCNGCNATWITKERWTYTKGPAGCSTCNSTSTSKGEKDLLKYILKFKPDAVNQYKLYKLKDDKRNYYGLDVFVPSINVGFEFNGTFWHSTAASIKYRGSLGKSKTRHIEKTDACEAAGIRLVHVWEHDWLRNPHATKALIRNALGVTSKRVYARKTKVKPALNKDMVRKFYNKYHIQGAPRSGITLGLSYQNKCVALMTFSQAISARGSSAKAGYWELTRFATSASIVGGASKLLKAFEDLYKPKSVISYSDRQHFTGALYPTLGFKFVHKTKEDYKVIWPGGEIKRKTSTTRANLAKVFGKDFDTTKTELANSISLGLHRIYDAGKIKWERVYENSCSN